MPHAPQLLREALNTLSFSTFREDEPMLIAKIIAALVQLAHARGNTRAQIHEAIDTAWNDL